MKLANCGRCGLEPVTETSGHFLDDGPDREVVRCPTGRHSECLPEHWNAAQFAARTERINAAAVAMWARFKPQNAPSDDKIISWAGDLISAQDAAARARWAEMQKGEDR